MYFWYGKSFKLVRQISLVHCFNRFSEEVYKITFSFVFKIMKAILEKVPSAVNWKSDWSLIQFMTEIQ